MQSIKNIHLRKIHLLIVGLFSALMLVMIPAGTALAADPSCEKKDPTATSLNKCVETNPIVKQIKNITRFLSVGAGIVIVGSIIWAGIQYIMAGNSPNDISAAKQRIMNSVIALMLFLFIFAILNWLLPGGLLFS